MLALAFLCLIGYLVYYYGVEYFKNDRIDQILKGVPTPPGALPIIGHAMKLTGAQPWVVMRKWAAEFGTMCSFRLFTQRVIYFNDPKMIKRVFQTHQRNYRKDPTSYKHFMCLLGRGLVTKEDEEWRKSRMFLSHPMRYDLVTAMPAIAYPAVQRLIQRMKDLPQGAEMNVAEEFRYLTLQVIGEATLSLTPNEVDRIFPALYLPVVKEANKRVWEPWRQFAPWLEGCRRRDVALAGLNAVLCDIIRKRWEQRAERKAKDAAQDMLDRCFAKMTELSDETVLQLQDDVKTMLLAGHETSSALLSWSFFEMMTNPDIAAELKKEHEAVLGKVKGVPSAEIMKTMQWGPAVLRETLRRHSVVPLVMRVAAEDDLVKAEESGLSYDFTIPKGCSVAVGLAGCHQRRDLWPDPEKWNPRRFLGYNPDESNTGPSPNAAGEMIDPYAFVAFIRGPRNCLGQFFSLMETHIVISYLADYLYQRQSNGSLKLIAEFTMDKSKVGEYHDYEVPVMPKHGLPLRKVAA